MSPSWRSRCENDPLASQFEQGGMLERQRGSENGGLRWCGSRRRRRGPGRRGFRRRLIGWRRFRRYGCFLDVGHGYWGLWRDVLCSGFTCNQDAVLFDGDIISATRPSVDGVRLREICKSRNRNATWKCHWLQHNQSKVGQTYFEYPTVRSCISANTQST